MSTLQHRQFALSPHPVSNSPAACAIEGDLTRARGELQIRYRLVGNLAGLRIPARQTPGFTDELWRHTCFELFLSGYGERPYFEFNFSPSGEWACYGFASYREGISANKSIIPKFHFSQSAGRLDMTVTLDLQHLDTAFPESRPRLPVDDAHGPTTSGSGRRYSAGPLALGVSAVVEFTSPDTLSYWALRHPLAHPDFHHPEAFALKLDEIRN